MERTKAAILVDIGNSETRCIVVYNNETWLYTLSNGFAKLTGGYTIPEDYINDKTNVLKIGDSYFANGELARRELEYKIQSPMLIKAKSDQESTIRTYSLCFIEAYKKISEITGIPLEELEIEFDIATALPPTEHKLWSDRLKSMLRGIETIEAVTPIPFTKNIYINDISVISEGAAAFTAVMYDELTPEEGGGVCESEANEMFFDGDVLVIDIGA